ncbi:Hvo_1808 family surface protein [Halomarina oriensis]|uniref:PGF-CTERM sorting domain-containing protein n=1 Tax=Halomarina oriensis TaxID=671145 RepID=A0A6B0GM44_9EURY|nr:Hvo_1808 family surface protein [Halomarina oriensis]MWG34971.1 PGF-CTERM sorting domain-containing protein [Halomarina oriensis]
MRRPVLLAVVLAVLTLSAPVAAAVPGSVPVLDASTDSTLESAQEGAPADPETDVLGWENGYWYNESIDVDPSDGLNDEELDKVVARSMARVEEVRGLEFERTVPVEIYTREQLQQELSQGSSNVSADQRLHQNVKYEATFMVGESTDAVGVQQSNQGASVGGYYSPAAERIVVVSENAESPQLDEITLSQELFHALQDQQFDIGSYNQSTREKHNAIDGIVEGDGNYVDYLYQQRCELPDDDPNAWGDCLADSPASGSGDQATGQSSLNLGLYLVVYQPYSDGPAFVRTIHEQQGWEAVNAIYENPPASTEQTIHPELYGEDAPTEVTIEDRSDDRWNVLELEGGVDYAEFGEGGIASMFIYPTYASEGQGGLLAPQEFLNLNETNQVDSFDPINYNQSWSNGWDGDKLLPYVADDAGTNETGYVWKMHWDSPEEAQEFRSGYERLLGFHGATQVGQDTYVVEQGEFADAFHVTVEGNTTTIVNAPTVEDLSGVDGSVEVQEVQSGQNGTTTAGTNGGTTATEGGSTGDTATGGTSNDSVPATGDDGTTAETGPGFGVVVALVALLAVALLARRE